VNQNETIYLIPFGDVHYGHRDANIKEFKRMLKECNKPNHYFVGLGDIFEDDLKRTKHLQNAIEFFNEISNYIGITNERSYNYGHVFGYCYPRIGLILAKHASTKSEKINYYEKALNFFLKKHLYEATWYYIENLFMIGETYYELGLLTNDEMLKKGIVAYNDAITFCKDQGYSNLVGSGYIYLAQIEDRMCNYYNAADNYKKASDAFDKALMTLTYIKAGKTIQRLKNYVNAWDIIETAKAYHAKEDHVKAQENYEQASQILNKIRNYKYESPFYSAWSILEKAEDSSKQGKHLKAAETYLEAKDNFENAIEILNSFLKKQTSPENIERIQKLIKVGETRKNYCLARHQIETARIESKKENHLRAAELYNRAGSLFESICQKFKIKREKDELTATLYLCKAWQNMEMAELKQDSSLFAIASYLFNKASENFPTIKMKKLSSGNSIFCSALENRILFDKTVDISKKTDYYKKIKTYLREASKNYQLGGFKDDAKWALATSTYFDGILHLIQADNELNFTEKNKNLNIATNYLNTALNIFSEVGSKKRSEEISQYLDMIKKEKKILTTASNIIEIPAISASSIGISAPSCPIEISSSANIEEMQLTDLQTESEKNWYKRIRHIYLFLPQGIFIYEYSFKSGDTAETEAEFISGGLTGLFALIKEVTKNQTKIKIIEQEELCILLEYGHYINAALISDENLITLRNKLKELIQEVEDFFQEELENFQGNLSPFSKIDKFIQKILKK
ncbi:MAG: tetratricopeptide repeat protein, partial [Candidatus Hodarchaeota archaeon]